MQIIIDNSGIKVCNQYSYKGTNKFTTNTHNTATRPPAFRSLRPIGDPPGFKQWTIWGGKASTTYGPFFTDWGRFGHGAFWLESWAVLDIDVGRFGLGRFGIDPETLALATTCGPMTWDRYRIASFINSSVWCCFVRDHRAALISNSSALDQTLAEAAGPLPGPVSRMVCLLTMAQYCTAWKQRQMYVNDSSSATIEWREAGNWTRELASPTP